MQAARSAARGRMNMEKHEEVSSREGSGVRPVSCSLNCQSECVASEKVSPLSCVNLMLTTPGSHMIGMCDMLRIIKNVSFWLLAVHPGPADHLGAENSLGVS